MSRLGRSRPIQAVIVRGATVVADYSLAGGATLTLTLAGNASLPDTVLTGSTTLDLTLAGDLTVAVGAALSGAATLGFALTGALTDATLVQILTSALDFLVTAEAEKVAAMDVARASGLRDDLDFAAAELVEVDQALAETRRALSLAVRLEA